MLTTWLIAMLVMCGFSAFFAASEAALFSLRSADRKGLAEGNTSQRLAAELLLEPERLLTAVLFWNLVANLAYFAIVSVAGFQLGRDPAYGQSASLVFGGVSLLAMMFLGELVPKSVGVLASRRLTSWIGWPLLLTVRSVDRVIPALRFVNLISQRLVWPKFQAEPYLDVADLERAIELSTTDASLIEQEQAALRNIVLLSDIRVDEWMRPRTQFITYRPPVSLADLDGRITPSGYLLITEPDTEEVEYALNLKELTDVPRERLEHYAEPVLYIPWCATLADALQEMHTRGRQVAAIVNEYGETTGILTFEDILDTIFSYHPSRTKLILGKKPIHDVEPGMWLVAGVTSLRRLARYLNVEFPPSRSVTITGVIQELLGRLAHEGDECDWGGFHLRVLEVPHRGHMLVELRQTRREESA